MPRPARKTTSTKIDFHAALRDITNSMVRLKKPERLLKMITRYIDKELGVSHTSLLFLESHKDHFTFVDSKGSKKVPVGLIKFDKEHPLIHWFSPTTAVTKKKTKAHQNFLYRPTLNQMIKGEKDKKFKEYLGRTSKTFDDLRIELAIPGYYKKGLLGMLLLGKKKNGRCFTDEEISFYQIVAQDCAIAMKSAEYQKELLDQNEKLQKNLKEIAAMRQKEKNRFYEILRSLAQEVYAKDAYTFGHVHQVERLGIMTAKELKLNLEGKNKDILSAGLILHDVGKIGIPDRILNKPARLDPEEWEIMKTHAEKGAKILDHLSDFKEVAEIVRCHHENFDGSGYPRGIVGEQIPIQSRIVSVVDAFHAIVSTRCYSKGRPVEVAFQELRRCGGTQFDPDVVEALIRGVKKEMKKRGVGFFEIEEELNRSDTHEEGVKKAS